MEKRTKQKILKIEEKIKEARVNAEYHKKQMEYYYIKAEIAQEFKQNVIETET